jgi:hypothetical protein
MEQDPPVLPTCWEQINDVWWNYLKATIHTTTSASTTSRERTFFGSKNPRRERRTSALRCYLASIFADV